MNFRRLRALITVLIPALLAGCGGGGIGGTGKQVTYDGLIVGVVDGFGSVIINNTRYETDAALVFADGNEAALADLKIGMKVSARISTESNNATEIHYQPNVSGPIQVVDLESGYFEVYGQIVLITDQTVFDEMTREQLLAGSVVEVSGDRNSENEVVARYIRMAVNTASTYATGVVELTENGTVLVAGKLVDFSAAAQSVGLTEEEFANIYLAPGVVVRISPTDVQPGADNSCVDPIISTTVIQISPNSICISTPDGTDGTDGVDGTNGSNGGDSVDTVVTSSALGENDSNSDVTDGNNATDGNGGDGVDGSDSTNGNGGDGGNGGDSINCNGGDGGNGGDGINGGNGGDGGNGGNSQDLIIGGTIPNLGFAQQTAEVVISSARAASAPAIYINDYVEVLGTVTNISGNQFSIDGFRMNTGSATEVYDEFETPLTLEDINVNMTVLIQGTVIDENGTVATKTITLTGSN